MLSHPAVVDDVLEDAGKGLALVDRGKAGLVHRAPQEGSRQESQTLDKITGATGHHYFNHRYLPSSLLSQPIKLIIISVFSSARI